MNNTKGNERFEVIGGADGPTSVIDLIWFKDMMRNLILM